MPGVPAERHCPVIAVDPHAISDPRELQTWVASPVSPGTEIVSV
jgi:hypothetical protein